MIAFIIDPALFSVPPNVTEELQVHDLILRMVEWDEFTSGGTPIRLFKLGNTEDLLFEHNCWPIDPDVASVINDAGLSHVFTPQEVVSIYHSLLSKAEIIADVSGFEATRCEEVILVPDATAGIAPAGFAVASTLPYVNASLSADFQPPWCGIVVCGASEPQTTRVAVSAHVVEACGEAAVGTALPIAVDGSVLLVQRFHDLALHANAGDLWAVADDHRDYFIAIAVRALQILLGTGVPAQEAAIPLFAIGPEFVRSLREHDAGAGQGRAGLVLETCARAIAGLPKYPLTTMGKPKQTIRAVDGATAWRTHITKSHEAMRLMIWRVGNCLELANIGVKGELVIEHGTGGAAFEFEFARVE